MKETVIEYPGHRSKLRCFFRGLGCIDFSGFDLIQIRLGGKTEAIFGAPVADTSHRSLVQLIKTSELNQRSGPGYGSVHSAIALAVTGGLVLNSGLPILKGTFVGPSSVSLMDNCLRKSQLIL